MENIIVAASNFTCILPLIASYVKKDFISFTIFSFVSLASITSHLIENHKHGMPGMGFNKSTSYILNRLDVMGCIFTIIRFVIMYYGKYGLNIYEMIVNNTSVFALGIIMMLISIMSEHDKYNANKKIFYIISHSIWHIGIYFVMYLAYVRIK